jgi:hypothetical protein
MDHVEGRLSWRIEMTKAELIEMPEADVEVLSTAMMMIAEVLSRRMLRRETVVDFAVSR